MMSDGPFGLIGEAPHRDFLALGEPVQAFPDLPEPRAQQGASHGLKKKMNAATIGGNTTWAMQNSGLGTWGTRA